MKEEIIAMQAAKIAHEVNEIDDSDSAYKIMAIAITLIFGDRVRLVLGD